MPEAATHWARITGNGLVYDGPCTVTHIIFWPNANADYVDIYDGRDSTTGDKFCRIETANQNTRHVGLGQGIRFGRGIYVKGIDNVVQTTIAFIPLSQRP